MRRFILSLLACVSGSPTCRMPRVIRELWMLHSAYKSYRIYSPPVGEKRLGRIAWFRERWLR